MFDCIILIPYRNRKEHLEYFLKNSWPLLRQYFPNSKLVVIEQEDGKLFNRGKLLNVGFKEYMDKTKYFITHDVDINPNETAIQECYTLSIYDVVRIYCGHVVSLGGICKFSNDVIKQMNGFPNHIWGWGIEDRALFYRSKYVNANISELYNSKTNFTVLHHPSNVESYINEKKKSLI